MIRGFRGRVENKTLILEREFYSGGSIKTLNPGIAYPQNIVPADLIRI
jgi:hypothetical protein